MSVLACCMYVCCVSEGGSPISFCMLCGGVQKRSSSEQNQSFVLISHCSSYWLSSTSKFCFNFLHFVFLKLTSMLSRPPNGSPPMVNFEAVFLFYFPLLIALILSGGKCQGTDTSQTDFICLWTLFSHLCLFGTRALWPLYYGVFIPLNCLFLRGILSKTFFSKV